MFGMIFRKFHCNVDLFWGSLFSVKYPEIVLTRLNVICILYTFKHISQFSYGWAIVYESDPSLIVYVCNSIGHLQGYH
jgi:hypothetical protein